jgi:hypothetical protein
MKGNTLHLMMMMMMNLNDFEGDEDGKRIC